MYKCIIIKLIEFTNSLQLFIRQILIINNSKNVKKKTNKYEKFNDVQLKKLIFCSFIILKINDLYYSYIDCFSKKLSCDINKIVDY